MIRFLADENIDYPIVKTLRLHGVEVFSVAEIEPSISDIEVLHLAHKLEAIIITNDKDFGDLIIKQHLLHQGIILIRLPNEDLDIVGSKIFELMEQYGDNLSKQFTVVKPKSIRVRIL